MSFDKDDKIYVPDKIHVFIKMIFNMTLIIYFRLKQNYMLATSSLVIALERLVYRGLASVENPTSLS